MADNRPDADRCQQDEIAALLRRIAALAGVPVAVLARNAMKAAASLLAAEARETASEALAAAGELPPIYRKDRRDSR